MATCTATGIATVMIILMAALPGPSALPIAAPLPCAALCALNLCSLCAFPAVPLYGLVRNKFVQLVRWGLAKTLPAQGRRMGASGRMGPPYETLWKTL